MKEKNYFRYSCKNAEKHLKKRLISFENDLNSNKDNLYDFISCNFDIYQCWKIETDLVVGLMWNGWLLVIVYYPDYKKAILLTKVVLQENALTEILPKLSQIKIYKLMNRVGAGSYSCKLKTKDLNASNIRRAHSNNAFNHRNIILKFFLDESHYHFDDYVLNLMKNAKENLINSRNEKS